MTRIAAVVLLLAAAAVAQSKSIVLVDGQRVAIDKLLKSDPKTTRVSLPPRIDLVRSNDGRWDVPTKNIVSIRLQSAPKASDKLFNLYLRNGDRLHGTVTGDGDGFKLASRSVSNLKTPLASVRAVRFGRLLHGLQAKYDEIFRAELKKGRGAVIIQRDTRPFPIAARVLGVTKENLTVLVGDTKRDLPLHKVYGFVRGHEQPAPSDGDRIHVRVHTVDGGRVTLPLEHVDGAALRGGGTTISPGSVHLIEFAGSHIASVATFDPIDVKEVGLFGTARPWKRDAMVMGGPLRLQGRHYERGIGVHAYARLEFALGKRWKSLFVRCGIDDAAGREGDATFRVIGDGKILKEIRCSRAGVQTAEIRLDVSNVDRLVLETDPGESYTSDFCDWAEARVFNAPAVQIPNEEKK